MSPTPYTDPVAKLLSYGDCSKMDFDNWPDYPSELGLTLTDVPELIRMATDLDLWESEEGIGIWAPAHAWRSLGQLRSVEAIEPLIQIFEDRDNEWAIEELPTVFALIGPESIPALSEYLCDAGNETWARSTASDSLEKIAVAYPDQREGCIASLSKALSEFLNNDDALNGLLICNLIELKATESASLIEQAFAADMVDEMLPGTWPAVQVELGLKRKEDFTKEELQPRLNFDLQEMRKLINILGAQQSKPTGFGAPVRTKNKKGKKKKKK